MNAVTVDGNEKFKTRLIDFPALSPLVLKRIYGFAPPAVEPVAFAKLTPAVNPLSTKSMLPVKSAPLMLFIVTV